MKRKTWVTFDHQFSFATTPPRRRGRWLSLALLLPLVGGVVTHTAMRQVTPSAPEPVAALPATAVPEVGLALAPATVADEPSGSQVDVVIRRNDTLERIFRQLKLSAADLNTVLNVPGVRQSFKQIKPGDTVTLVHDGAVLHAINRRISETEVLSVTRGENGFAAEIINAPVEIKPPARGNDQRS